MIVSIRPLCAITLIFFVLILAPNASAQQLSIKSQLSYGNVEHFSVGLALTRQHRSTTYLAYGSDPLFKTQKLSAFIAGYERIFHSLAFHEVIPGVGIKGGTTIYADEVYRWRVITGVPMLLLQKNLLKSVSLSLQSGIAISRIESVQRLSYAGLGKYKRYQADFNIMLRYTLFEKSHAKKLL